MRRDEWRAASMRAGAGAGASVARWAVGALCTLCVMMPLPGQAATDFLSLRERLEVERPKLREGMGSWIRKPAAVSFPAEKPGVAFAKYLELAWRAVDARTNFPEVQTALHGFRGQLDPANALQRQALGVLLGDYLQVRYGNDLERELGTLVGFRTFDNVVDRNADNPQFKACFDSLAVLATRLGLQARNHAYETLEIRLPATGSAAGAAPLGVYVHADVPRPIEHKWSSPPFVLKGTEDRLRGAGVADDKGPLLVNLFALRVLRDAGIALARPVVLVISATGEDPQGSAAASLAALAPRPALVLAADGVFPWATGERGQLVARVTSQRGMKSRPGIQAGQFYVHRLAAGQGPGTMPAEARVWIRYESPAHSSNPSLVMTNRLRAEIEAYQKTRPQSVYEIYVQEDTLHYFVYGTPGPVEDPDAANNSLYDAATSVLRLQPYANSARDILQWIDLGMQRDATGASLGLAFEDAEMGGTRVAPVGFDRLGDEVTVLVDVRWPAGHDAAWIRKQFAAAIAAYNQRQGTRLRLDWEPGGREPQRSEPPAAVQAVLSEAYALASGETAPPAGVHAACARLLPEAIPFGPASPRGGLQGHQRDESISRRELQDLGVAYLAALVSLATGPLAPAP